MANEQISQLENAHITKCLDEIRRQVDAVFENRRRLEQELLVERILNELRIEVELLDGFYYEKPIQNQTRISGEIEDAQQSARNSIEGHRHETQSHSPPTDPEASAAT
ncbi:unnamed protein product [Caenorhabditis angaria]|uniref:Uncharacterized protein n=1 Tax=Caenorhabditis angaria TaxID=860376 RepID=A0A9P1ITC4_9PELO|nr:unnamed protein product [Caenorhabditis angaria]